MRKLFLSEAAEMFSNAVNAASSSNQAIEAALSVPNEFYVLRECLGNNDVGLPYASVTGPLLLDKLMATGCECNAWIDSMWLNHVPFDVVLQLLLKYQMLNAQLPAKDESGWVWCPAMIAIERGRNDWLDAMINAGLNTDMIVYRDKTSERTFNLLDFANYQKSWMCAEVLSNKGLRPTRPDYVTLGIGSIPEDMQRTVVTNKAWVKSEMDEFMEPYGHAPKISVERMRRKITELTPDNVANFYMQALARLVFSNNLDELTAQRQLWAATLSSGDYSLFSSDAPKLSPFTHQHPDGMVMQLLLCLVLAYNKGSKDELAVAVQWLNDGLQIKASDELVLQVAERLVLHDVFAWKRMTNESTKKIGLNDCALDLIFRVYNQYDRISQHKFWMSNAILSNKGLSPTRPNYMALGCRNIPEDMQKTVVTNKAWVAIEMDCFMKQYAQDPKISVERMRRAITELTPDNVANFYMQAIIRLILSKNLDELTAQRQLWAATLSSGDYSLFSSDAPKLSPFTHQHPNGIVMQLLLCLVLACKKGLKDELAVAVQWLNDGLQTKASDELVLQIAERLVLHDVFAWELMTNGVAMKELGLNDMKTVGLNDYALDLISRVSNQYKANVSSNGVS